MAADIRKRKWDEEGDVEQANKSLKTEEPSNGEANGAGSPVAANGAESAVAAAARIAAQYAKPADTTPSAPRDVPDGPDAAFFKDIDINDSRNRYVLTKGATQEQVKADTGATVVTKGTWLPDRSKASEKDPALYLHITAPTQAVLDAGVEAVEKLLAQELGPLVVDYRSRRNDDAPRERRKWPEEKIPVNLDSLRNFNVRAKIVGPQGLFVKYIQQETSARVQIKGLGSGFIETDTGRESDEPMHVHISGPEQIMVDKAKDLADDLLIVVREEWGKAKGVMEQYSGGNPYSQYQQAPPPPSYDAPAPPSAGGYAQPPPPPSGQAPAPPGGAASGDIIAQAQAMAPQMDRSLLEFYAGHSQDPAVIVYYAQLAMQYQQQGYYGADGGAAAAAPAGYGAAAPAPAYGAGYQSQPPPPSAGYGRQPSPPARQGRGSYAAMPPPSGL